MSSDDALLKDLVYISTSDSTRAQVARDKPSGKCRLCTGGAMNGFQDYGKAIRYLAEHLKSFYACDAVGYTDEHVQYMKYGGYKGEGYFTLKWNSPCMTVRL